jgi:hypothetical protein
LVQFLWSLQARIAISVRILWNAAHFLSTKEIDIPIVPESECDFSLNDRIAFVFPEEPFHSVAELLRTDDVEINSGFPFDADDEMEIAAS